MNPAFNRNVGSFLRAVPALAATTVTAGGGADNVAQNGITFDRTTLEPLCLSALAVVHCEANVDVGNSATASVAIAFQDSADGTNWDAYDPGPEGETYAATVIAADGHSCVTRKIQLGGARRYVRMQVTVNPSAANTDTVKIDGVFIVGGADELPITAAVAEGTSS